MGDLNSRLALHQHYTQYGNVPNRTIFCHDNLEILQGINSECIDLIYLDPPFNKKKIFTAPIGSSASGASFKDIFTQEDVKDEWVQTIKEDHYSIYRLLETVRDIEGRTSYNFCYLAYMAIRLIEMHRVLKDTGSMYLHCDQTMSHYIKLLMDCIFGEKQFVNEIVWKRATSEQKGSQFPDKTWGVNTDSIFMYTKGKKYRLLPVQEIKNIEEIAKKFPFVDEKTRRRYYDDSAHIWRTPKMGDRPNLCYEWRGFKNPHSAGWRMSKESLEREYKKGNFVINSNGKLQRRKYIEDYLGLPIGNLWTDINPPSGEEDTKYPTQKPLALLERIIKASSNKGDMILDPFCGCATTCVAAEKLERQWIGIDISVRAYELVQTRIQAEVYDKGLLSGEDGYMPSIHFQTDPPQRTDSGRQSADAKYVYVISHKKWRGEYKVGIASDWKSRLNQYQTGDPNRSFKIEYKIRTSNYRKLENYIHEKFDNKHEWVRGDLSEIIKEIEANAITRSDDGELFDEI